MMNQFKETEFFRVSHFPYVNFFKFIAHEKLVNDVYKIYLEVHLNQNGVFTQAQKDQLKQIASTCVTDGGMIVYFARGLLTQEELADVKKAVAVCERDPMDSLRVKFQVVPQEVLGLKEKIETKPDFALFPNPAGSTFTVNLTGGNEGSLQITDITGKIVGTFKLTIGENVIEHKLQRGIYIVNIKTEDGIQSTQKLFIQ